MRVRLLTILTLLFFLFSCKEEEVEFPTIRHFYEDMEREFSALTKTYDSAEFNARTQGLLILLADWEEEILTIQNEKMSEREGDVFRDWNRNVRRSYQLVVDSHVESYIFRDEIMQPRYFEVQKSILRDLDQLQLALNHFMIQIYPIRELDMAFYKNIPEITSQTSDPAGNLYYIIKVNIGYIREEKITQTALNNSKMALEDIIRSYCSQHYDKDFSGWNEINLKAGMMKKLNDHIARFYAFKSGKMEGIKILTFSKIQTFTFN